MEKTYKALRKVMAIHDMNSADIGRRLMLTQQSISNRMTGRSPWRIDEMYSLMELFGLPYDQLHIIFPPNGVATNIDGRGNV